MNMHADLLSLSLKIFKQPSLVQIYKKLRNWTIEIQ